MSFEDLPDDWAQRPVDDPALVADVLDLVVSERDRRAGALMFLMCDDEGRLVQPVSITDVPDDPSDAERNQMIGVFASALREVGGTLLLAIARPDGLSVRPGDTAWARAARRGCSDDVRLLGVHIVTTAGSRLVPAHTPAA